MSGFASQLGLGLLLVAFGLPFADVPARAQIIPPGQEELLGAVAPTHRHGRAAVVALRDASRGGSRPHERERERQDERRERATTRH